MKKVRELIDHVKARLRGEKKIAKGRGRVYARSEDLAVNPRKRGTGGLAAKVQPSIKVKATVIRADGSTEEITDINTRVIQLEDSK